MSKLKLSLIVLFLLTLVGAICHLQKPSDHRQYDFSQLFNEETRLWGKAAGPVQARIEFKEQSGNRVTLTGQIRSTLSHLEVEWQLPPGTRLVEGSQKETIEQKTSDQVVYDREITVEVEWPLENPHLVLRAAESENKNSFGASTAFNLDPKLADLEKEEIIRAHMKSRNLQKLVK